MIEAVIAGALLWDCLFAEPPSNFHPTVWMGRYINLLWEKRPVKQTALFTHGIFIIISGAVIFGGPMYLLKTLAAGAASTWAVFTLLSIPLLKVTFSLKYLFRSAGEIRDALQKDDLDESRRLTSWHLVSRDTSKLSARQISSCVIESVSENITDSFTSPLFYYCMAGLPGAFIYRFINTSDAMIAYRKEDYEWGGKFTAWCDSLLNLIPARLTSLMIVTASFIHPKASGAAAWRCL
ncbi:MAG: adenosylcobinamide-phosphate synthase CbiB, partial [Spirochaetales bacterium]|nr:adenosylcobinamide-phosphate synthase CbiB [Spirochaetales bacterium]